MQPLVLRVRKRLYQKGGEVSVREPVNHARTPPLRVDQLGRPQDGKMPGDGTLRQPQNLDQLSNVSLPVSEQQDQPQANRLIQRLEYFRNSDQIFLRRRERYGMPFHPFMLTSAYLDGMCLSFLPWAFIRDKGPAESMGSWWFYGKY